MLGKIRKTTKKRMQLPKVQIGNEFQGNGYRKLSWERHRGRRSLQVAWKL